MPVPTVITDLSTTISSNSPSGGDTPSVLDDHLRAHAGFIAQLAAGTAFTGTIAAPTAVRVNGATQGGVGVRGTSGSGQTAGASYDELVIDSSGTCGMSILSGTTSKGAVVFGDAAATAPGRLEYDHSADTMALWAANAQRALLSSVKLSVTGQVWAVTSTGGSGQAPNTNYDNFVIDSENNSGMTILSGASSVGGVRFGRLGSNTVGGMNYAHSTDTLSLIAGATTVASVSSGAFSVPIAMEALSISTTSGSITSKAGLGFTTGAGGTVTQATSKSTAVTLNKFCGRITMDGAALAGNTAVSFTLNNNNLTDASVVNVCIRSGCATGGSYSVIADSVSGAGTCRISVRNLTSGPLSEALVLSFNVIDGQDS